MAILQTWAPSGTCPETFAPAAFTNLQEDQVNIQALDTTGTVGSIPSGRRVRLELVASADLLIRNSAGGNSYLLPANMMRTVAVDDPRSLQTLYVQGLAATGTLYARKITWEV